MEKLKNANPEQLFIHPEPGETERKTDILTQKYWEEMSLFIYYRHDPLSNMILNMWVAHYLRGTDPNFYSNWQTCSFYHPSAAISDIKTTYYIRIGHFEFIFRGSI